MKEKREGECELTRTDEQALHDWKNVEESATATAALFREKEETKGATG